jgi:hypothetical protein
VKLVGIRPVYEELNYLYELIPQRHETEKILTVEIRVPSLPDSKITFIRQTDGPSITEQGDLNWRKGRG